MIRCTGYVVVVVVVTVVVVCVSVWCRLHEFDDQVHWVREGMAHVIPVPMLSLFTGYELEMMVWFSCLSRCILVSRILSLIINFLIIDSLDFGVSLYQLLVGSKGFRFWRKTDEMTNTGRRDENIDFWRNLTKLAKFGICGKKHCELEIIDHYILQCHMVKLDSMLSLDLRQILPPKCYFLLVKMWKFRQKFCHKSWISPISSNFVTVSISLKYFQLIRIKSGVLRN